MVGRFVTLKLRKKCAPEPAARENRSFPMSEKKITLVNIYNFIRMSHQEPSEFLEADFDTIRGFIFGLLVGVVVGTASTIFVATPVAYDLMAKRAKGDKEE